MEKCGETREEDGRGYKCYSYRGMMITWACWVCWSPQSGEKGGMRNKCRWGDVKSEESGVRTDVGEEVFGGVAICCFCCPVVGTVSAFSQAHFLNLNRDIFVCASMRDREKEVLKTLKV